ncbi:PIN domain-containing protein [Cereibacter sphaeroides]|nr:PIN domain-containing protein [Cereibacter sphaeroides]
MAKVFLDTCVLFPPLLRSLLLGVADSGLYDPVWSEGVEAEWLHLNQRKGETPIEGSIARMRQRWPEGVAPAGEPEWLDLPDPADRHILAATIAAGASTLLTLNLRDFPRRTLAPHGITAISPDDFMMMHWLTQPAIVEATVAGVWPDLTGRTLRNALKKADLPRLGRALES